MSDRKQDQRLAELMTEFLENTEEKGVEVSNDADQPVLDGEKMLSAIDQHRNEIDALKDQLKELREIIRAKSEEEIIQSDSIEVPEIIALQTTISSHSEQINKILKQHDEYATVDDQQDKRFAEINQLREELKVLKEDVRKIPSQFAVQAAAKPIGTPEIVAVQHAVSSHSTKIDDLELKHDILKTDVEKNKGNKRSGFGMFGWLLLASNILLWSVLGIFFWKKWDFINSSSAQPDMKKNLSLVVHEHNDTEEADVLFTDSLDQSLSDSNQSINTADVVLTDQVTTEVPPTMANNAEVIKIANVDITKKEPKTKTQAQLYAERIANEESSKRAETRVVNKEPKRKTQAQLYAERMAANEKANKPSEEKSSPVLEEDETEKREPQRKTQAQLYAERMAREKNNKPAEEVTKPVVNEAIETETKEAPVSDNPDVRFED